MSGKNDVKNSKKGAAKPAPIQSRAQVRNAAAAAGKHLRGIDNEVAAIKKVQKSLDDRTDKVTKSVAAVSQIIQGISNIAMSSSETTTAAAIKNQAKAAAKAPVKAAKAAAKVQTKTAPKVQSKPAAKTKPKPAAKAQSKDAAKAQAEDRPALKTVIDEVLKSASAPMKASTIYLEACKRYGRWSRQSLYNALKDKKKYAKAGDGANATFEPSNGSSGTVESVTDDAAENLIRRVENSDATANVS